ncbi:MAG: carbohydrate binding domain-containing protein, partial [Abditibacteriaceae bacterium]
RKVFEGEGLKNASQYPEKDKGVDYYSDQLIKLQKEFARQLLEHKNPYTGRTYADEPGVCAVEVTNEDSLVGMWLDGKLNQLLTNVTQDLNNKWNTWLKKHYDEDSLSAAWHESSEPLSPTDLLALPYPPGVVNPNAPDSRIKIGLANFKRFRIQDPQTASGDIDIDALGGPVVDGAVRPGMSIYFKNRDRTQWGYRLNRDGLDLREGQAYTLSFWGRASSKRRVSVSLWQDRLKYQYEGFTGYADLGLDWQHYTFVFRPLDVDPQHSRLNFNLGKDAGTLQIGEVTLHAGGQLTVPQNWTLANGVPLIDVNTTQVWRARRDFAGFLGGIENDYSTDMQQFLKDDLNVRCPIWISQAQFGALGGLVRESHSDAVDVHAYWKHPIFSEGGWDGDNWSVGNTPMSAATGRDPLAAFAHLRLKGKPFVMSEWNSGQPSNFGAETLPMVAAYASWQDWAAVYLFDYHSNGNYNRDSIHGFFSIDSNPTKMITAPAAALMYRQSAVTPAREEITLTVPRQDIWFNVANSSGPPAATPFLRLWHNAGALASAALRYKTSIQFGDVAFPTPSRAGRSAHKSTFKSDTGELQWDKIPALFTVNSPKAKVIAGTGNGASILLGELQIQPTANQYGVIMLSSIDGKDVAESKRLLVTALGDAQNIGTRWNANRDSISDWGKGPTYLRGISAQIRLLNDNPKLIVWSLDATGARRSQVPSTYQNGALSFTISPQWQSAWYEISAAP